MVELTTCEKMVYDTIMSEERVMSVKEITELTNEVHNKKWLKKVVKVFLDRLAQKECSVKTRIHFTTYYEAVPNDVIEQK